MSPRADLAPVAVWDPAVRWFHWLLVVLVAVSAVTGWFAAEIGAEGMQWHKRSGYCILTLVLFRIAWGFAGSTYARFASFSRGPRAVVRYLTELFGGGTAQMHVGHNPLGGWSVMLMLASLAAQTGSGLFIADEDLGVEGPLAKFVSNRTSDMLAGVHETNFYVLLILVAAHVAAILFYLVVKHENLIAPMFSGNKRLPADARGAARRGGPAWLAVVLLLIAIAIVSTIATR